MLMLRRLRDWLFGSGDAAQLPERVREAIERQQEQSEILIGWVQLVIVVLVATVYETSSMPGGVVQ
jgi:adenylate cyclase